MISQPIDKHVTQTRSVLPAVRISESRAMIKSQRERNDANLGAMFTQVAQVVLEVRIQQRRDARRVRERYRLEGSRRERPCERGPSTASRPLLQKLTCPAMSSIDIQNRAVCVKMCLKTTDISST